MRQQIDIVKMCEALMCLGHNSLWLRENSGQRFLITWDNLTVAHFESSQKSWSFQKHADVVNDNPNNDSPPGNGLTPIPDGGMAFQLMMEGY